MAGEWPGQALYTTLAHPAESAFLVLRIIRRTPPVLLVKMGLISDRSARLKKRPYQNQMKLFKSNDCKGFCLHTGFYRGAIKRSSNCQMSVQFLPSSSCLNLPLGNPPSAAIMSHMHCVRHIARAYGREQANRA